MTGLGSFRDSTSKRVVEGKGEEFLRCESLFTVCHMRNKQTINYITK